MFIKLIFTMLKYCSVPHKKGKKKKRTRAEMYETRGYGAGERGEPRAAGPREREAPGGSSHPDTRYADMAPKYVQTW